MKKYFFLLVLVLLGCLGCGKQGFNYGPYSIGRDLSWYPVQIDQQGPNLNAFTNALVQEIAKEEHLPLQIYNLAWGRLFESLEENEVAAIFTSLTPTVITQAKYSFSDPFLYLGPVLVVRSDLAATSLSDMENKIVSVNQFDESVLLAQRYPSIVIELYQNKALVLESLKNGDVDGVLIPILDAEALVPHLYQDQLKIVTQPLNNKALRLVTLKDANKSLLKRFNRGLDRIRSSGNYVKLRQTYQLD